MYQPIKNQDTMRYILFLLCSLFTLTACEHDKDDEKWENRAVFWSPNFILLNEKGENLFEKSIYKEDQLSLIVTNEQGEPLLDFKGNPIADIEGTALVLDIIRNPSGRAIGVILGMGYTYLKEGNTVTSYYKFKYDSDSYDTIKVIADAPNNDFVIKEIYYNNTHYSIPPSSIEIIKKE